MRFMKRLAQKMLTLEQQQQNIAKVVELMFITIFHSPITSKAELLQRVWLFFENDAVGIY